MGQKKTTTFRTKKIQDYLITSNQPPNFRNPWPTDSYNTTLL